MRPADPVLFDDYLTVAELTAGAVLSMTLDAVRDEIAFWHINHNIDPKDMRILAGTHIQDGGEVRVLRPGERILDVLAV